MNIHDFMPLDDIGEDELMASLIRSRADVFRGFGILEVRQGTRKSIYYPLWGKEGQDLARNFMMRCIEEVLEAAESQGRDHVLEELVDSFFYLLSIPLMDPEHADLMLILPALLDDEHFGTRVDEPVPMSLGPHFLAPLSAFLETLRNRSWQQSVQQPYFSGGEVLWELVSAWCRAYLPYFRSRMEFLLYCEAKHRVLTYRLSSSY